MATIDYHPESEVDSYASVGPEYDQLSGQAFLLSGNYQLASCKFYLYILAGYPPTDGYVWAELWSANSSFIPQIKLATSGVVDATTLPTSPDLITFTFTGDDQYEMEDGNYYAIVLNQDGLGNFDEIVKMGIDLSGTHDGKLCTMTSDTWQTTGSDDECCFYLYGSEVVPTYTLTYNAGANGSISGTSPQLVSQGSDGTAVEAVPDTGYHFVEWSDSSTDNPRTDTNVQSDITVTATFAINEYTLTYAAGGNGSITGTTPQTVNHGSSGTAVTAVPDANYEFTEWSDSSTANPRTDTNVQDDISVTASFAAIEYTLTYTAGANGNISGTSPQTVQQGSDGTAVEAVPDSGYEFVEWSDSSTDNPRTDTNVQADINVSASFTLTITQISTPTISATDGTHPDKIVVTASEPAGATEWHFYKHTEDDSEAAEDLGAYSTPVYTDTDVYPGTTYYYWVQCASTDPAYSESEVSDSDTGYAYSVVAVVEMARRNNNIQSRKQSVWIK